MKKLQRENEIQPAFIYVLVLFMYIRVALKIFTIIWQSFHLNLVWGIMETIQKAFFWRKALTIRKHQKNLLFMRDSNLLLKTTLNSQIHENRNSNSSFEHPRTFSFRSFFSPLTLFFGISRCFANFSVEMILILKRKMIMNFYWLLSYVYSLYISTGVVRIFGRSLLQLLKNYIVIVWKALL